jgi:mRNA interferase RelE/StbE
VKYRLVVAGKVRRYIGRLDAANQRRVVARLEDLVADPYSRVLSKPLQGTLGGIRSSELGGYRILYEVDDVIRLLEVIDIGPRGDVYKR